ncbi:MAG: hypothetical protein H6621_04300 [Halobacteriovoraceae bacterium]|nr:hypothetical protein [Halobacteriovoraceae bacterium]
MNKSKREKGDTKKSPHQSHYKKIKNLWSEKDINTVVKEINQHLEDENSQKKAALIIENWLKKK